MTLHKIKDFDPDYRDHFDEQDIIGFDLYSGNDKVGSVDNILVDDSGSFRYFVISTGAWIFGKKTLLPIGRARIEANNRRVYVDGLSRSQIESLPEFNDNGTVDYDQEERTRDVYRPTAAMPGLVTKPGTAAMPGEIPVDRPMHNRDTYDYKQDSALYDLNERDHQNLKLYEERLITSKTRAKTGEVAVGKRIETETSKVSVPIDKERVVIERTAPTGAGTAVTSDAEAFQEGEVARVEVYEETPDILKEAFVREEVSVRKEVDRETVNAEETLRREELDIDTEGRPIVDKGMDARRSPNRP